MYTCWSLYTGYQSTEENSQNLLADITNSNELYPDEATLYLPVQQKSLHLPIEDQLTVYPVSIDAAAMSCLPTTGETKLHVATAGMTKPHLPFMDQVNYLKLGVKHSWNGSWDKHIKSLIICNRQYLCGLYCVLHSFTLNLVTQTHILALSG